MTILVRYKNIASPLFCNNNKNNNSNSNNDDNNKSKEKFWAWVQEENYVVLRQNNLCFKNIYLSLNLLTEQWNCKNLFKKAKNKNRPQNERK